MKYINADELVEKYSSEENYYPIDDYFNGYQDGIIFCHNLVKEMPSADVVEVKHGEWLPCNRNGLILTELTRQQGEKYYGYKCSNCNHIYHGNALIECSFCQKCGADMREWSESE